MNKTVITIFIFCISMMIFAGCSGGGGQVTLAFGTLFVESEPGREIALKVIGDFEKEHPNIKINLIATANEIYESTKLRADAAADQLPDVFFTWLWGFSRDFVEAGRVVALDDHIKDGTKEKLIDGALDAATYNGKVYGLPTDFMLNIMYVNEALFANHGVKIPDNSDEWLNAVVQFDAQGVTPMCVGGKENWTLAMCFDAMMISAAGHETVLKALSRETDFSDPGFLLAAKKFEELCKAGAFSYSSRAFNKDESEVDFLLGKIPMYVMGSWENAKFQSPENPVSESIAMIPLPQIVGGKGNKTEFGLGVFDGYMVASRTKHTSESLAFLKYFCEHYSAERYRVGAAMPVWKPTDMGSVIDTPLNTQTIALANTATAFVPATDVGMNGAEAEYYLTGLTRLYFGEINAQDFIDYLNQMP